MADANTEISYERWMQRLEDTVATGFRRLDDKIDRLDSKVDDAFRRTEDKIAEQANRVTRLEVKAETRPVAAGAVGSLVGIISAIVAGVYAAFKSGQ